MNTELILRGIDAEIDKLLRVRAILLEVAEPAPIKPVSVKRAYAKRAPVVDAEPEPRVTILPPRQKREYTRRPKPAATAPNALSASVSDKPVFVPKTAPLAIPAQAAPPPDDSALEAAMRQHLLGGAAPVRSVN
ncbi:hypothetical protein SAMN05421770_10732 [Granulicella rosea]|uniref:Uncharacterized protein n=1 Tax=Granulicella rosea TaxID=474952 RepID=A0A239LJ57_9BACT|nr:hypothetical protein [Granulicella rosea]SNT29863.1 hypothetical protein SAMN05421770_10732 [Granulicella rosea]